MLDNVFISSLFPLTGAILTFLFGLFVLLKNYKSRINLMFSLFCLAVIVWLLGTFLMFNSKTDEEAIFWDRFAYIGVIFIPILMVHFIVLFTKAKQKTIIFIGYTLSIIFLFLSRTNYFVDELYKYSWGVHTKAQFFHHLFLVYFFIYLFLFFLLTYLFYKKTDSSLERTQAKYILIAFGIMTPGCLAYLPAYGISIYPIVYFSMVVGIALLGYAVVKYRLMDIRVAIGRGAIYFFSFITIVILAFFLIFLNNQLAQPLSLYILGPLIIIISLLIFQPIFRFYEKLASKYFYYTFYSYQKVLTDLGRNLTKVLDLDKLCSLIVNTLIKTMKLDKTVILLKEPAGEYQIQRNIGFQEENGISLVKDNFLTIYLEKTQKPLVYEEISLIIRDTTEKEKRERLATLKENMKRIEAALCLPLFIEEKIMGMIVLGNKLSAESYSSQDIELLTTLSNQASIAFQNARLYSKVEDLSKNLEKRVKEQTKELQEAYEELKVLDKAKSEFISMASHQLRTPLSAIKGYISMLIEGSYGKLSEKVKEKMENVFSSNERLIQIVNDLLNISKIELGKMELEKEKVQIEDLIQSCSEEMRIEAEKKNLAFIFKKPATLLPKIEVDSLKIRQVILNLIDNAIRYTQKGKIEIWAEKTNSQIQVIVKDTGEGLTPEEEKKIFEGFTRGGAGITHWIEGAGLGLYVAKKYLELHQGKIWVESKGKGKGSTFYFELLIE